MFCPSTIIPCLSLLLCGELSQLPQVSHVLWDPLPPVTDQETVEAELAFARRPPQIVEALMGRLCGVLKLPGRHSLAVEHQLSSIILVPVLGEDASLALNLVPLPGAGEPREDHGLSGGDVMFSRI